MTRILVFGDSIAWGAWDIGGGWVQHLSTYLMERILKNPNDYYCVFNLSVSGDTSKEIVKRFDFEAKYTISKEQETIIIFAFGINDPSFTESLDKPLVSEKKFVQNITLLYRQAKKYTSKIIFVGPTPVYEPKTNPWFKGMFFSNKTIKKYDDLIRNFCSEKRVNYIGLFRKFKNLNLEIYIEDGLHPNSKGHELIFEIVKQELEKNKIIY